MPDYDRDNLTPLEIMRFWGYFAREQSVTRLGYYHYIFSWLGHGYFRALYLAVLTVIKKLYREFLFYCRS